MHGFVAILRDDMQATPPTIRWKSLLDFQPVYVNRSVTDAGYYIEQFTSSVLIDNKYFIDNERFIFLTDGLIFNLPGLLKQYHARGVDELVWKLYGIDERFFSYFEGNFAGLFYDKLKSKWLFFNNQTATKRLFYYHGKGTTVVSTDLYTLKEVLKKYHSVTLDIEAAYVLLSCGFMHENMTLLNEVKQCRAGEYISISAGRLVNAFYFHLNDIEPSSASESEMIAQLDFLFREALKLEFEMNEANGINQLTTLSAGLDSRMALLVARKMGYQNQSVFNFSLKGYADDVIACKIADDYQFDLHQVDLRPSSLLPVDSVLAVDDGLMDYTGCSHLYYALSHLNFNAGVIHTGMIGDAVMGSFVSQVADTKPVLPQRQFSNFLFQKALPVIQKTIGQYRTEEVYKFYSRAYLRANTGFLHFNLIGEASSPFLNVAFLSYAYSLPRAAKYKERLYIEWIKKMYPDFAAYTWEAIGGRPTNNNMLRLIYRTRRAVVKRLPVHSIWRYGMAPEPLWFKRNLDVRNTLDSYFADNLCVLSNPELTDDVRKLYDQGSFSDKTQALTLLGAVKLLLA
jgi:asparagine synthase (glutamine-hydrolysing)